HDRLLRVCSLRWNDEGPPGAQTERRGGAGPVGGLLGGKDPTGHFFCSHHAPRDEPGARHAPRDEPRGARHAERDGYFSSIGNSSAASGGGGLVTRSVTATMRAWPSRFLFNFLIARRR